ncbi:dihydroneopterin triphosphate diphosphatase [Alteromonas oceanisediminis]|uniref:dihydroneopterin triphosphate diphosphatase n=1 Tax=Alteromonas oceanisediminis TaxID=2836180 RepID=UPI001BD9E633|nr:dihydroneopterin triphosphate diphosphatase [Alteromonas oceanisediminis]MBT0587556.1 dihydroneopterin triphosphate diphosphatase [Alteromonas oceanisediminis]
MTALKRPESALVILYDRHSQVLLLQRNDDPVFWQSVTGTVEEDELPLQTAYREVMEETGIQLDPRKLAIQDCHTINQYKIRSRWLYRYPKGVTSNTEYVFAACIDSNVAITLTEHSAFEWQSKAQAMQTVWSETNRLAIERFVPEPA